MMQKVSSSFSAIIFFGFMLFAVGVFFYVLSLVSQLGLSPEILIIILGILLLIFGVTGARMFSSLQLAQ
jgi:hypothetical protein